MNKKIVAIGAGIMGVMLFIFIVSSSNQLVSVQKSASTGSIKITGIDQQAQTSVAKTQCYVYVAQFNWVTRYTSNGSYSMQWGSYGTANGQMANPNGIDHDSFGNIYVADTGNRRVQKFTPNGVYITQWGSYGFGPGQFVNPNGIAVDSFNNVYVSDPWSSRVQKFTPNGVYITQWGSYGFGPGQFSAGPFSTGMAIAVDSLDNIFVTDKYRVQKFNSNGVYLSQLGASGNTPGRFTTSSGIAIDSLNNIYVSETSTARVQKFAPNGTFMMQWGGGNMASGQIYDPRGITADAVNNIFVVSGSIPGNTEKFNSLGQYKLTIPSGNGYDITYVKGNQCDS